MNKSILECLETDYKLAIEQMITRILFPSAEKFNDEDLPLLRMEYMIDDQRDIYKVHIN